MPESPPSKVRPHPARAPGGGEGVVARGRAEVAYAELCVTSNFTFLTGASHPEELVERAAELGHVAAAVADVNTLAGIVRAHVAAKEAGIPLAVGCRVVLTEPEGFSTLVFATDRASYGRLCRLLTLGKRRAPKGKCFLTLDDLVEHQEGLLAVALPVGGMDERWRGALARLRGVFDGDRLSLAVWREYGADDRAWMARVAEAGERYGVPLVATNNVHYHVPRRRVLQDVVTCIRLGCTIEEAGLRLAANAERHLKAPGEMARLFAEMPGAVARSAEVARRAAAFSLDELRYEYPEEVVPPGRTPMEHLTELTWKGAAVRYPRGVPEKVAGLIRHELALIDQLNYAPYFLTVHDLVSFARGRGILCQGRGAAANSAVCYCLGVTSVDPDRVETLFERFISRERNEPPDIDIDFEHERREEVIQYLYGKYGRERAALTAVVISYRSRSAVREVGKAMGLSLDCVDRLAKSMDWWDGGVIDRARIREQGINPDDPTLRMVMALARELLGFPRHLSQHVGGFVLTKGLLSETVPIENAAMEDRTVIEWDKDDIDALGILKVDVLGLGMLTCIRKCFDLINARHKGTEAQRDQRGNRSDGRGCDQDVPGPDRVAEGQGTDEERRSGDGADAAVGDVRAHKPGAAGGGGLPEIPAPREGIAGRAGHAVRTGDRDGDDQGGSARPVAPGGGGPPSAVADHEDGSEGAGPVGPSSNSSSLCASVPLCLDNVPPEDPATYDMICGADTIGVFQIESRAQMTMLPRLRPRCYYDLVIEVAIVRPGPIQGNMVHPYLRRREGLEPVTYPSEAVRAVLARTLGVPLFQEQAMRLAIVAAGFTAGEADQLRRAMASWKRKGDLIARFGRKLIDGMTARGYEREFAERCFEQIKGFSEYGFPESHAASFALLVYVSAWLKRHHPAAFAAALLNSQPMGFYGPAQIVRDAQAHGVEVRPVDVNRSAWDCTLEETPAGPALRLGMRMVKGLAESEATAIEAAVRRAGPFRTVAALRRASGVRAASLRRLAAADAFGSMGLDRQRALWAVRGLTDEELPLFEAVLNSPAAEAADEAADCGLQLPPICAPRKIAYDYASLGLSLKGHPMAFVRDWLDARGAVTAADLRDQGRTPNGRVVMAAGIVVVRQRPATAKGTVFMTVEDETGAMNLIVRQGVYKRYRRALRGSVAVLVRGRVERRGEVSHVLVRTAKSLDGCLKNLAAVSRDFH